MTLVDTNAAAALAAVGGSLVVSKLLPVKYLRLFPRSVLTGLASLCAKSKAGGVPFEPAGKTVKQIIEAVKNGTCSKQDAVIQLCEDIQNVFGDDSSLKIKISPP